MYVTLSSLCPQWLRRRGHVVWVSSTSRASYWHVTHGNIFFPSYTHNSSPSLSLNGNGTNFTARNFPTLFTCSFSNLTENPTTVFHIRFIKYSHQYHDPSRITTSLFEPNREPASQHKKLTRLHSHSHSTRWVRALAFPDNTVISVEESLPDPPVIGTQSDFEA